MDKGESSKSNDNTNISKDIPETKTNDTDQKIDSSYAPERILLETKESRFNPIGERPSGAESIKNIDKSQNIPQDKAHSEQYQPNSNVPDNNSLENDSLNRESRDNHPDDRHDENSGNRFRGNFNEDRRDNDGFSGRPRPDTDSGQEKGLTHLYVCGFPSEQSEEDLRPEFEAFGKVELIRINTRPDSGRNRGVAFVHYFNNRDAENASNTLNNTTFNNSKHPITVKFAIQNRRDDYRNSDFSERDRAFPRSNFNDSQSDHRYKECGRQCRFFEQGGCIHGDRCSFKHGGRGGRGPSRPGFHDRFNENVFHDGGYGVSQQSHHRNNSGYPRFGKSAEEQRRQPQSAYSQQQSYDPAQAYGSQAYNPAQDGQVQQPAQYQDQAYAQTPQSFQQPQSYLPNAQVYPQYQQNFSQIPQNQANTGYPQYPLPAQSNYQQQNPFSTPYQQTGVMGSMPQQYSAYPISSASAFSGSSTAFSYPQSAINQYSTGYPLSANAADVQATTHSYSQPASYAQQYAASSSEAISSITTAPENPIGAMSTST